MEQITTTPTGYAILPLGPSVRCEGDTWSILGPHAHDGFDVHGVSTTEATEHLSQTFGVPHPVICHLMKVAAALDTFPG